MNHSMNHVRFAGRACAAFDGPRGLWQERHCPRSERVHEPGPQGMVQHGRGQQPDDESRRLWYAR